ncbi:MAG: isoprenylcysteine carboxylmethyltransferase family protein [Elusimicrobiaceae bacterium]
MPQTKKDSGELTLADGGDFSRRFCYIITMNILGIGPSIMGAGVISIAALLVLEKLLNIDLSLSPEFRFAALVFASVWGTLGLSLGLISVRQIASSARYGRLITTGVYSLSRNPLYAAFIIFIVPSIACLLNDLFLVLASGGMYLVFAMMIKKEEQDLKNRFGAEYLNYAARTSRLCPLPPGFRINAKKI